MTGPVAITGATGFIGRTLCAELASTHPAPVRALVRNTEPGLPDSIDLVHGSLDDEAALEKLVQDSEVLVHCAGAVRGRNRAEFEQVNVQGTARLLHAAAAQSPPPRLVLVSTLAARNPELSHYAATKAEAEQLCQHYPGPWTILRPTAVYGPGDRELLPLLRLMALGIGPAPRLPAMRVTLIHVSDLVAAILAAMNNPSTRRTHELSDARTSGYGWPDLHAAVARVTGRRVIPLPLPVGLLRLAGQVNQVTATLLRRAPMLTPGKVRELTHPDWQTELQDFMDATGWAPRTDLESGLRTVLKPG